MFENYKEVQVKKLNRYIFWLIFLHREIQLTGILFNIMASTQNVVYQYITLRNILCYNYNFTTEIWNPARFLLRPIITLTWRVCRKRAPGVREVSCSCSWGRTLQPAWPTAPWRLCLRVWGPVPGWASRWDQWLQGRWMAPAVHPPGQTCTWRCGGSSNTPARPARTTIWQSSVKNQKKKI